MRKFITVFLGIIIVLGFLGYAFFSVKNNSLSDTRKKTAMEKLLGREPILSINPHENEWTLYQGKYLIFTYPINSLVYHHGVEDMTNIHALEDFEFQKKENPKYFFVIQVIDRPSAIILSDIPDVLMRENNSDNYRKKEIGFNTIEGVSFTKVISDSVEKTAFFLNKGREYSFAITGVDPQIFSIFDRLLKTAKIK